MEALVSTSVSEDVEDGKTQTKESQLRQILGGNAKHGAAMDSAASASVVGVVLGEDPYTGAAIKLEELFFYWLSQKETVEMVEGYVSAVVQGQAVPLEMTSEASSIALRSLNVASHPQLLIYGSNQPPRSPTATPLSSPPQTSSLFRRSFLDAGASSPPATPPATTPLSRSEASPETNAKSGRESISPVVPLQQPLPAHSCASSAPSPRGARLPPAAHLPLRAALPPLPIGHGGTGGKGKSYPEDSFEKRRAEIEALAASASSSSGFLPSDLTDFTRKICRLPGFLKKMLHRRVRRLYYGDGNSGMESPSEPQHAAASSPVKDKPISLEALCRFYREEIEPFDAVDRLFRLLKQPHHDTMCKDDFAPLLSELLCSHPGLEFLRSHPDFQQKYALTVTTRIFYAINRSGSGRITARELRRSKLLDAMRFVDENEDINKETRFFSYEHFYVLYCRFWELDTDRDGFLTREDLLKYGQHSLSNAIVDRIFEVGARPFSDGRGSRRKAADKMAYDDFIYFMLSEEDKGNEASLRFWFDCVDVDGDGRITYQEMRAFYNVQLQRMEWLGHELVPFDDVLAQMLDMLKPSDRDRGLVFEDFLVPDRIKITGVFFDALFNLNKFIQFEQRDPFGDRQKREDPFDNDWERFAFRDYQQLAMDEEENDGYPEDMDGHVSSMDVDEGGPEWTMEATYDDMGFEPSQGQQQGQPMATGNGSENGASSEAPF